MKKQLKERGDLIKEHCGKANQVPPVTSSSSKIITTEEEQSARWFEHFKNILNRPEPDQIFALKAYRMENTALH